MSRAAVAVAFFAAFVLAIPMRAMAADCARAEELEQIDLNAARDEYVKLLKSTDAPSCAEGGLDRVSAQRGTVANLLVMAEDASMAGKKNEAKDFIVQVLQLDPANETAQTILVDLVKSPAPSPSPSPSPFDGAYALFNSGYKEAAREQAQEVAKTQSVKEIPSEFDQSFAGRIDDGAKWVASVAGGLAIVAIIASLAVALLVKLYGWVFRRRPVTLGDIKINRKDETESAEGRLKTAVAAQFIMAARSSRSLTTVDAARVDMPELIEVPEQLKVIGKLVQVALRREMLTVSATATPREKGAFSVVAQISGRRKVYEEEAFETAPTEPEDLKILGSGIAAWAMFALRKNTGLRRRSKKRISYPFGTTDWKSYTWVRNAEIPDLSDELKVQRQHRALLEDPRNVVALASLGNWEAAKNALAERPSMRLRFEPHVEHARFEPLWYQVTFSQAGDVLDRYLDSNDPGDLQRGRELASELVRAIAATWTVLEGPISRFSVNKIRRGELRAIFGRGQIDYVCLLAAAWAQPGIEPLPVGDLNLDDHRKFAEVLNKLLEQKEPDRAMLLGLATMDSPRHNATTLYNQACVWARFEEFQQVLDALKKSFAHEVAESSVARVDEAEIDRSFRALRNSEPWRTKFDELIRSFKDQLPKQPAPTGMPPGTGDPWIVEILQPQP